MQHFTKYLKPHEERQLFATVRGRSDVLARRDAAWMQLMRSSGLRVQAVARLTVADAELALARGRLEYDALKKRRAARRDIPAGKKLRGALKALLAVRREMGAPADPDAPLIMSRNHRGISVRSMQARVRHWQRVAGLEVMITPHWFRHTLAKTIMRTSESRDPRGVVASVLDHESIATTVVYTLPDRDDIDHAMEIAA